MSVSAMSLSEPAAHMFSVTAHCPFTNGIGGSESMTPPLPPPPQALRTSAAATQNATKALVVSLTAGR